MSVLLFVLGGLLFVAGAVLLGLGYVLELSLGNSLIVAGMTAMTGGLILVGLGAVVRQLQRIREALTNGQELGVARPRDLSDLRAAPSRVAFPPKPKLEPKPDSPARPAAEEPASTLAPARMSEALPSGTEGTDEVPLSPETAPRAVPPLTPKSVEATEDKAASKPPGNGAMPMLPWRDSVSDLPPPPWRTQPGWPEPRGFFDKAWNGDRETAPLSPAESAAPAPSLPRHEAPQVEPEAQPETTAAVAEPVEAPVGEERRVAAVLKSGVVDGMGYTLYVDGSIEAELPQGTLRFASISELRKHLESNS